MRASDLIGLDVTDATGHNVGRVSGLRCVQDGPIRGVLALPRIDALIVHRRRIGGFLGYQLRDQSGPAPVGRLMRWIHHDARLVPLTDVENWSGGVVLLRGTSTPASAG